MIEQLARAHQPSAQNFIHLLFITCANVQSKSEKKNQSLTFSYIDADLLSYLTVSLVRLSTYHTQMIGNETSQLRHLLAHRSLNDSIRVGVVH